MSGDEEDQALIANICLGDESALSILMGRHKQGMFHFVYRYLHNEEDASEVVEEAFFKVYINAHRFKTKASVKTWMFSIALNLARDRLRKQKHYHRHISINEKLSASGDVERIEMLTSSEVNPKQTLQDNELEQHTEQLIAGLPEKLRLPFILCVLEEHSYEDCAQILKTNRKAIETRIYRARQLLKNQLSDFLKKS